jgi:DNA-binding SARP family transcriptional activator
MGLRLLGPLEFVVGSRSLKIGGPKEQVVLAALALNANRATSIDHLVDAVWDTSPPHSARGQVQKSISGIRKLFGDTSQPVCIKTGPPGYLLEIPPHELDSAEFARLVSSARGHVTGGRVEAAYAALRDALALWRGPALDGIHSDLVQRGAALLNDARFSAIEERVRLDLEMGQHEEVSRELNGLIDAAPLRERSYGYLMLALYRSGRQAEALEVFRRARATFVNEVGIEPGKELHDLEHAILVRDPALDYKTPSAGPIVRAAEQPTQQSVTPRQLPGSTADFVGREDHIAEIKWFLSDEASTQTAPFAVRVVAISGKGGVGKSMLALRVAHELSDAFPDGHLYADLQGSDAEDRTATLLARFLRALGVAGSVIPEDPQERAELYRSLLANKRLLVVLDSVTSEEQVWPLLPGTASCPVIATSRMRLTGLSGARWIDVDVFDTDKSIELLARIVGHERVRAEESSAVELVKLCGGLPLALRIAGGRLASRPKWRIAGLVRRLANEARRLDEFSHRGLELRSSIGLTYRSLPHQAKRLFRLFALIPASDFPGWTAAALLDTLPSDADDALAQLVDAQVLEMLEYPGGRIRYRFHDLIQIYAHEQLIETESSVERRGALSRLFGAWLALAEKAHRKEYGGDYTVLHGTAPRWHLVEKLDADPDDDPTEWWESERRALVAAVRQAAAEGMDELCWELAVTLTNLFEVKSMYDDWRETAQLAHDVTERTGNRLGHAAALYSLGFLNMYQKRLPEAERCLDKALEIFEAEGSTQGCAIVLPIAATVDRLQGKFSKMLTKYEDALVKSREVRDPVGEAYALRGLATFWIDEGDFATARNMLDDALALCQGVNFRRGEAQVLSRFVELYLATGQTARARHNLHRVLRIVRDIGDRTGEAHALFSLGLIRKQEGKLDNAETTLVHALTLARQIGERMIEARACHALGELELARGNNSAAADHLLKARSHFDTLGSALWSAKTRILLADVYESDGDFAVAGRELTEAAHILSQLDSREATRLLNQLADMRSALLANDVVGCSAVSDQI